MKILIIFTILTAINVIFSTVKSIMTIKSPPAVAALISGLYYGFYNMVLLYTVADFPMWQKIAVTAFCNIIGVYIVKTAEMKMRKDRLWCIQCTVPNEYVDALHYDLKQANIPNNYVENVGAYSLFFIYSYSQKESEKIKPLLNQYQVKYFVAESKTL